MFAKRLRDLREKKGLQQKDIATSLGVLEATVSMWETGKRIPYSDMLIKIANFFNVSVDYLLGNDTSNTIDTELKEKETLKKALKDAGFMNNDDDMTDEELNKAMEFLVNNKKFLKNNK